MTEGEFKEQTFISKSTNQISAIIDLIFFFQWTITISKYLNYIHQKSMSHRNILQLLRFYSQMMNGEFLSNQVPFGGWGYDKQERVFHFWQ